MDGTSFEVDLDAEVTCTKCHRRRPFPECGDMVLSIAEENAYIVDTGQQCGDGGLGCQETKVRIRITIEF